MVHVLAQMRPEEQEAVAGVLAMLWGLCCCFGIVGILFAVVAIAGMWKTFEKAGKPGWAAIILIYNLIILLEIVGKPVWWIALLLIPVVNAVVMLMISLELARKFGKSAGFGVGLWLLAPVFYCILGFGSARYQPE